MPITEWCEQQQLSIEQRLRLFRQVCDAVQYAHQHLIVHRDIKPGNILVTADGVPKLLDFGIAKLLDTDAATGSAPARDRDRLRSLMTPDYASPEQVRGEAVSTATDVYSLGAVLYELLTGQRPHVLRNLRRGRDRARRVRHRDPAAERARESPPARRPRHHRAQGDAEGSGAALLVGRAVLGGHPAATSTDCRSPRGPTRPSYRAMKFVRRHRLGVAATAAVVAALAVGVAVSLHEARVAQRRFAQVRELANTFLFQFYDQVTPLAGSTAVRASIVETARKYLDGLSKEAGGDRDLILELAQAYERLGDVQGRSGANLGQLDDARRSYQHALDLYAALPVTAASPPDLRRKVANVLWLMSRLEYRRVS